MHLQSEGFTTINSLHTTLANLRQGDYVLLDLDNCLWHSDAPHQLKEAYLAQTIARLQESNISVIGFTHSVERSKDIAAHLQHHLIQLNRLLYGDQSWDFFNELQRPPQRVLLVSESVATFDQIKAIFDQMGGKAKILCLYYQPTIRINLNILPEEQAFFPENLSAFNQVESLGGGTASTFKISSVAGPSYVLKLGAHPQALNMEILSQAVYRILNVPIAKQTIYTKIPVHLANLIQLRHNSGVFLVSEFLQAKNTITSEQIKDQFLAHVLLGNIDLKEDNFIGPYLIDAGASFIYRSLGKLRNEDPNIPNELNTLTFNQHAIHAHVCERDLKEQVLHLISKRDAIEKIIWELSHQLAMDSQLCMQVLSAFSHRFDYLVTQFAPELQAYAQRDRLAHADLSAAGILSYTFIEGEAHVLLSQRVRHRWWDNFGGKSESADHDLANTAVREVFEESSNQLSYNTHLLANNPSHDLIITRSNGSQYIYRMFIIREDKWIDCSQFTDSEHTDYLWVPLHLLIKSIQSKEIIYEEGLETGQVIVNEQTIILFPPLFKMLRQKPVLENLLRIAAQRPVKLTHTQSHPELSDDRNKVKPLPSPAVKKQQIADTLTHHSQVLRQLKSASTPPKSLSSPPLISLSQSEVQIKLILDKDYEPSNLSANIKNIIKRTSLRLKEHQLEHFVAQCVQLIEIERKYNNEYVFLYHACNQDVAASYAFFSAIYEILRGENNWPVFRGDNEAFLNFDHDIKKFMDHYRQEDGIDNNLKGYHECGLSTNLFLFGNYLSPVCFSLYYLKENRTARSFNFEACLRDLLQYYALSENEITQLLMLVEDYRSQQQSTLYQIGVPRDLMSQLTYPAGSLGVENPYGNSHDVNEILSLLHREAAQPFADIRAKIYAEEMQVRLFATPTVQFMVNKRTQDEFKGRSTLSTDLKPHLKPLITAILQKSQSGKLDQKTALLRIRNHVYQQNFLPIEHKSSVNPILCREFVEAILNKNVDSISQFLSKEPELKHQLLHYYPYVGKKQAALVINIHTLDLLLKNSLLSHATILNSYSISEVVAHFIKSLASQFKYRAFVFLVQIIAQQQHPLSVYDAFSKILQSLKNFCIEDFLAKLNTLSPDKHNLILTFLNDFLGDAIQCEADIVAIIESDYWNWFLQHHENKIHSIVNKRNALANLLNLTLHHTEILQRFKDTIDTIQNFDELMALLASLNSEDNQKIVLHRLGLKTSSLIVNLPQFIELNLCLKMHFPNTIFPAFPYYTSPEIIDYLFINLSRKFRLKALILLVQQLVMHAQTHPKKEEWAIQFLNLEPVIQENWNIHKILEELCYWPHKRDLIITFFQDYLNGSVKSLKEVPIIFKYAHRYESDHLLNLLYDKICLILKGKLNMTLSILSHHPAYMILFKKFLINSVKKIKNFDELINLFLYKEYQEIILDILGEKIYSLFTNITQFIRLHKKLEPKQATKLFNNLEKIRCLANYHQYYPILIPLIPAPILLQNINQENCLPFFDYCELTLILAKLKQYNKYIQLSPFLTKLKKLIPFYNWQELEIILQIMHPPQEIPWELLVQSLGENGEHHDKLIHLVEEFPAGLQKELIKAIAQPLRQSLHYRPRLNALLRACPDEDTQREILNLTPLVQNNWKSFMDTFSCLHENNRFLFLINLNSHALDMLSNQHKQILSMLPLPDRITWLQATKSVITHIDSEQDLLDILSLLPEDDRAKWLQFAKSTRKPNNSIQHFYLLFTKLTEKQRDQFLHQQLSNLTDMIQKLEDLTLLVTILSHEDCLLAIAKLGTKHCNHLLFTAENNGVTDAGHREIIAVCKQKIKQVSKAETVIKQANIQEDEPALRQIIRILESYSCPHGLRIFSGRHHMRAVEKLLLRLDHNTPIEEAIQKIQSAIVNPKSTGTLVAVIAAIKARYLNLEGASGANNFVL